MKEQPLEQGNSPLPRLWLARVHQAPEAQIGAVRPTGVVSLMRRAQHALQSTQKDRTRLLLPEPFPLATCGNAKKFMKVFLQSVSRIQLGEITRPQQLECKPLWQEPSLELEESRDDCLRARKAGTVSESSRSNELWESRNFASSARRTPPVKRPLRNDNGASELRQSATVRNKGEEANAMRRASSTAFWLRFVSTIHQRKIRFVCVRPGDADANRRIKCTKTNRKPIQAIDTSE
jgi:hypothetical protein